MKSHMGSRSVQSHQTISLSTSSSRKEIHEAIASLTRDRNCLDRAIAAFEKLALLRQGKPLRSLKLVSVKTDGRGALSSTSAA